MSRTFSDDAIVLHAYDVGEADRLCILLTRNEGKVAMRAPGVRKLLSRKGGSLLPLQHVRITYRAGKSGMTVQSTDVIAAHDGLKRNVAAYGAAIEGSELLLRLLEDESAMPEAFDALSAFLDAVSRAHHPALLSFYTVTVLDMLGMMPSLAYSVVSLKPIARDELCFSGRHAGFCMQDEAPDAVHVHADIVVLLREYARPERFATLPAIAPQTLALLSAMTQSITGSQLGSSMRAGAVSRAISSGVTPTW